jgi:hypothetical protein
LIAQFQIVHGDFVSSNVLKWSFMIRRVQYPAGTRFADFADFQINYLNYRTGDLIPNSELWIGNELKVRINSLACKGEELDPALGVIGIFGDSAVFGSETDAWPFHIGIPGYQALLTAVEGHDFKRMYERYQDLRGKVRFDAVVVAGSWHNLAYNRHDELYWNEMFGAFCDKHYKTALCTLPAGINDATCKTGIDHLVANGAKGRPFAPWGWWPTSAEKMTEIYTGLLRYNACVRRYCKAFGTILIDLFEAYQPSDPEELAFEYFDPCHPRPSIYPTLAAVARKALESRLPARHVEPAQRPAVFRAAAGGPGTSGDAHLPAAKVYPLW